MLTPVPMPVAAAPNAVKPQAVALIFLRQPMLGSGLGRSAAIVITGYYFMIDPVVNYNKFLTSRGISNTLKSA